MFIQEYYPFIKTKEIIVLNGRYWSTTLNVNQILHCHNHSHISARKFDALVWPYPYDFDSFPLKDITSYEILPIPGTKENISLWHKGLLCSQEQKLD